MTKYIYTTLLSSLAIFSSCSKEGIENRHFSSLGIEMVSHKGIHFDSIAPPNSLDAILLAHRAGFKTIEIDLNRTADNEIILLHDNHLNETFHWTDGYRDITQDTLTFCFDWSLKDMRERFVFSSPNPAMRRSVATMEEALKLCKRFNILPYLEFKEYGFRYNLHLVDKAIVAAQNILGKDNFVITSWNLDIAEYVRKNYPYLVVMCDPTYDPKLLEKHSLSYFPNWEHLNSEIIEEQHQEGYTISTWTVDKTMLDSVSRFNVDKILTDNIAPAFDRAKAVFNNHSNDIFSHYTTNGLLENNTIQLQKGESIELKDISIPSIYFGAIHFSVDVKGKFEIESTDFNIKRENLADDFKLFNFQYMIFNKTPHFKIIALEDNTIIKSIWFAVSEY